MVQLAAPQAASRHEIPADSPTCGGRQSHWAWVELRGHRGHVCAADRCSGTSSSRPSSKVVGTSLQLVGMDVDPRSSRRAHKFSIPASVDQLPGRELGTPPPLADRSHSPEGRTVNLADEELSAEDREALEQPVRCTVPRSTASVPGAHEGLQVLPHQLVTYPCSHARTSSTAWTRTTA
ncbi:hypothetical protein QJS66_05770 [Kocuria rhizophila]|nr:hypothetical protein QJS66_05770 [Kocuria rhizophila]